MIGSLCTVTLLLLSLTLGYLIGLMEDGFCTTYSIYKGERPKTLCNHYTQSNKYGKLVDYTEKQML